MYSGQLPKGTAELTLAKLYPVDHEYINDPTAWIEDRLGDVWSKQADICDSVCDNRHTAVRSCHGPGKSYIAAGIVAWWQDVHPHGSAFAVTTAPTQTQIRGILWRELARQHRKAELDGYITNSAQPEWKLDNLEVIAFGRKPADYIDTEQAKAAFQGIHARYVLVVLDEAAGIPRWLWEAVEGLTTNDNARVLAIGNPDDPASEFAKVCAPGSGWNVIEIDAFDTPNFTGEEVSDDLAEMLTSQTWVEERRKRWGEGTPLWESRVRGRFPKRATDTLIHPDWIFSAQARDLSGTGLEPGRYGVDVARAGHDQSVILRKRGGVYRVEYSETGVGDTMVLAGKVHELIGPFHGGVSAVIDIIGVGAGVYDRCSEMGLNVVPFQSSEKALDNTRYANRRAEMFWALRELFEDEAVDLDTDDEELANQLGSIKWKINSSGRIQIESKEEMKKRGLPSPDRADAMMMALVEDAMITRNSALNAPQSQTGDLLTMEW